MVGAQRRRRDRHAGPDPRHRRPERLGQDDTAECHFGPRAPRSGRDRDRDDRSDETADLSPRPGSASAARSRRRACSRTCRSGTTCGSARTPPPPRRPSWLLEVLRAAPRALERRNAGHAAARAAAAARGAARPRDGLRRSSCSTSRPRACRPRSVTISRTCCAWRVTRWARTIVLIEHDLGLVWRIADRITVLDAGDVIAAGLPAEILADPRVRNLFAGSPRRSRPMLETRNLHSGYGRVPVLRGINLAASGRRSPARARRERRRQVDAAAHDRRVHQADAADRCISTAPTSLGATRRNSRGVACVSCSMATAYSRT